MKDEYKDIAIIIFTVGVTISLVINSIFITAFFTRRSADELQKINETKQSNMQRCLDMKGKPLRDPTFRTEAEILMNIHL